MAVNFDDQSTGISYQNFPKDPEAREQIAIVKKNVEELKNTTVSRQVVTNLENKFKQNELDNENYRNQVAETVQTIEEKVDGLDGGNTEKIANLEAAVKEKANKDLVDSLLNQIEGSVKQINGVEPDEAGNVVIDLETQNLVGKPEFTQKTDLIARQMMDKIERVELEEINAFLFQTDLEINDAKGDFSTLKQKLDNMIISGGGGGSTGVLVAAESEFGGNSNVTKTYTTSKDGFAIINDGTSPLTFVINGLSYTVNSEESWEGGFLPFTSVLIQTTGPYRAYSMVLSTSGGGTVTPEPDTTIPIVTISPNGGNFTMAQQVTMSVNEAATIYYTLNGTTPTVTSTVYTGPIAVSTSQTIKAMAKDTAGNSSAVVTNVYTINIPVVDSTPPIVTASLPEGTYTTVQTVTLSANETSDIFYTLDGTTPTISSAKYTTPLNIDVTKTLKFFGKDTAGNTSSVVTRVYTINIPVVNPDTTTVADYDPFIKLNSTTSLGTTLGGKTWETTGTYGIKDFNPYVIGSGDSIATVDMGFADGEIEWTVAPEASGTPRYIFRAKSNTQYYAIQGNILYRFMPDFANMGTISYGNAAAGDKIKVMLKGDSIKIYRNNVLGLDIIDATLQTATRYGFGANNSGPTFGEIRFSPYATDDIPPLVTTSIVEGTYPTSVTTGFKTSETADIYYTLDGSIPTTNSTKYTVPLTFTSTTTLKYIAKDIVGNVSPVSTKLFTITTPSVIVSDTFTRGDSTTTLGAANTGQVWTAERGVWGISGNKGTAISGSDAIAVINSGIANGEVSFVRTGNQRLIYRYEGLGSYFMVQGSQLFVQINDILTHILTGTVAPVDGDTVKIVFSGKNHKFYVNNALSFTHESDRGMFATKHGVGIGVPDSTVKFDDFKVMG